MENSGLAVLRFEVKSGIKHVCSVAVREIRFKLGILFGVDMGLSPPSF